MRFANFYVNAFYAFEFSKQQKRGCGHLKLGGCMLWCNWNEPMLGAAQSLAGKLCHARGAADEKYRPTVFALELETVSRSCVTIVDCLYCEPPRVVP